MTCGADWPEACPAGSFRLTLCPSRPILPPRQPAGARQKAPYPAEVEAGKTYFWCACGLSQKQPYCDGSHKATGLTPLKFTAEATKKVWLCGCKQSANKPFCDGSHKGV